MKDWTFKNDKVKWLKWDCGSISWEPMVLEFNGSLECECKPKHESTHEKTTDSHHKPVNNSPINPYYGG